MDTETKEFLRGMGILGGIVFVICFMARRRARQEGEMDKDKKKIIAGAGILGGAVALYLLLKRPTGGEFQLSNLIIEPTMVNVGEPVTVGVTVTNIGETTGTKIVRMEVT